MTVQINLKKMVLNKEVVSRSLSYQSLNQRVSSKN